MVRPPWRPEIGNKELHRKFSSWFGRSGKLAQKSAKYPFQSQLNFGPDCEVLMEYHMEVVHWGHMFSIGQGYEHLSE